MTALCRQRLEEFNTAGQASKIKRVATLFIVDEPKELAKLIQDTTLSSGTMRPEEMYEFLRARCDFKTIESKVDAEMYGIKVREDCVIT